MKKRPHIDKPPSKHEIKAARQLVEVFTSPERVEDALLKNTEKFNQLVAALRKDGRMP